MKNLLLLISIAFIASSCVKTEGKISMRYNKATAIYADLDSIRSLPLLEASRELVDPTNFYVGEDFILVGEANEGIHIYDNVNSQNPVKVAFIRIPYNKEFYVKGNNLYAESLYDLVKLDITDVYNPTFISRANNVFWTPLEDDNGNQLIGFNYRMVTEEFDLNSPEAAQIKKEGELHIDFQENLIQESSVPNSFTGSYGYSKGTISRMAVEYGYVYVISDDKLHVVEDGFNLSKTTEVNITEGAETVYAEFGRLYIGGTTEMSIYNVMTPSNPTKISELAHTESCDPVLPIGDIAYYTLRSDGNGGCNSMGENTLNIVDLSNEEEPVVLESIQMNSPYGMGRAYQYLMVGDGTNGLKIFDASQPDDLQDVLTITGIEVYDVMLHPFNTNVVLTTNSMGIEQFQVDWNTLTFTPISQILY
jgi:hypothetical protein